MNHATQRAHAPANPWKRLAVFGLLGMWCLAFFTVAAQARGYVGANLTAGESSEQRTVEMLGQLFPRVEAPVYEVVWQGKDVDGDGAADFANPTGQAPREHDGFGSGAYGASRDGGHRRHEGVDYIADAGQTVVAPISGYVSHIGYAYGDSTRYRYVEITNPALGYEARIFYIAPDVKVGQAVRLGTPIGRVISLQPRYAGITDHVHLEVAAPGQGRIDASRMIAQRTVRADLRG